MPGTQRTIPYLEGRFESGDIPTQTDFQDFFASFIHYLQVKQTLGTSTTDVVSQKAVNDAFIALKDGVPTQGDTLNKLYNLITSLGEFAGNHDASGGSLPASGSGISGAIDKGDYWYITVGGTISGLGTLSVGDVLFAKVAGASSAAQFFYLPFATLVPDASETVKGKAELLDQTESEAAASAGSAAGADHTRVASGRGMWWFWEKVKTIAQTWTAKLTATDFLATNQAGTGFRFAIFDSSGNIVRNANVEYNNTTGEITVRGLDNLDASYALAIYNQAGQLIARFSNGRFLEVGGGEFIIDIDSTITSGNARIIMNDNQAMGLIIEGRDGKEYLSFRTTDNDERVNMRVPRRLDVIAGNLAPMDETQFTATANATNSSVTLIGSIPMSTDEQLVTFEVEFIAVSNTGAGGFQRIKGAIQRISGGTVQNFASQVSDAIQRTAGTFLFSVDADNTNKRININFTQNSSGGIAYLLVANVKFTRLTEPA